MGRIRTILVCILAVLITGMIAADVYVSWQIETILSSVKVQDLLLNEVWIQIQRERLSTILFSFVIYLIVLVLVLKIGGTKRNNTKISQYEAKRIVEQMMQEYKEKGILLTAKKDEDHEKTVGIENESIE